MAGGHGTGAVPESLHLFHTQQAGRAHSSPGTQLLILPKQLHLLGSLPSKGVPVGVSSFKPLQSVLRKRTHVQILRCYRIRDDGRRMQKAETCREEPNPDSTSKGNKIVLEEADQR